jgi:hypothetical protein
MARFIPAVILLLIALGLLIGGVEPAWWIVGLVALGLALASAAKATFTISGREYRLGPYFLALVVLIAALGLLIAGITPAWWITALVAAGIALVVFMSKR